VVAPVAGDRRRGDDEQAFALEAAGQPVSVALWRNLGGFGEPAPYRSIGVEPMLGRVFDLADAGPGDAATVPVSGTVDWRLTMTMTTAPVLGPGSAVSR
jgi:hypothetical protein